MDVSEDEGYTCIELGEVLRVGTVVKNDKVYYRQRYLEAIYMDKGNPGI